MTVVSLIGLFALVFTLANPSQAAATSEYRGRATVHVVAWGDSTSDIASRYGVAWAELTRANDLDGDQALSPGTTLLIPRRTLQQQTTETFSHTVSAGETLYRIANQYGTTIDDIIAANPGLTPQNLLAGQTINIPGSGTQQAAQEAVGTYTVQRGDTLASIASSLGVATTDIANANSLINPSLIYVGQVLTVPGAPSSATPAYTPTESSSSYTVQAGDTLFRIANQNGLSTYALAQANNISSSSLVYVGQVLTIPRQEAVSQSTATPSPSAGGKSIIVDVSDQRTYLYENGTLVTSYISSTGLPGADTWRGTFAIQNKLPVAYAYTWGLTMPFWLGFYWAGPLQNGFHALPIQSDGSVLWDGYLGTPISYGCVVLSYADMEQLYYWAEVGTPVTVRD